MMGCMQKSILIAVIIMGLGLAGGCVHEPEQKPTSFEKWREQAANSRGWSPPGRQRSIDLSSKKIETLSPVQETIHQRSLPTRKISMKMHQTEVAVILRALARSISQNIMINENVKGRISINVTDGTWNEVFLGILKSQGLAYEWEGDIIRIVTSEDRERNLKNLETEEKILAKKRAMELQAPLVTKIIPIDFAPAEKIKENVQQIISSKNPGEPVGTVLVDTHTNTLVVQATPGDIARIIPLITELDRPTAQILIEAHIVETTNQTARQLGIQWGGLFFNSNQKVWVAPDAMNAISGVTPGSGAQVDPPAGTGINFPANLSNATQSGTGLNLGLITQGANGILALQLSALEEEGKLNILSSPSITTIDNTKALIESGDEIPIAVATADKIEVEYKSALLSLEVTPHVIQDSAIKLEIVTTKDEVSSLLSTSGYPTILTKKASTVVILYDGQTTVIGGLKKNTNQLNEAGVPFLSKIPVLGYLFKNQGRKNQMEEVLIFITPHILKTRPAPQ